MNVSLWIWLVCALLLFWCVGLYQRLLRLRLQAQQALAALEPPLSDYGRLLSAHFSPDASGSPLPPAWQALTDAVNALPAASQSARNAPFAAAPLRALAAQMEAISVAWAQVQAQPADLAGPAMPPELAQRWQEAEFSARAARAQFNTLAMDYNQALQQIPARLVVPLMGFKPAPSL